MSESLRDQLLKAGFKEPTKAHKKPHNPAGKGKRKKQHGSSAQKPAQAASPRGNDGPKLKDLPTLEEVERAEREQKKALKAQIKTLIEENHVGSFTGTNAYSYLLGNKVRQLYVNDECRARLGKGELVITRLNGNTHLVPPDIGKQILAMNPDWLVVIPEDESADKQQDDGDYGEYQIPDDLIW